MKEVLKKTLSLVLCFAILLTMFQGICFSTAAKIVGPDKKTQLTITTDKLRYSGGDTILFTVDVKNITNEVLTGTVP